MQPSRVFVVDDEPMLLRALAKILRMSGYVVETFDGPRAFLAHLSDGDRGCALVDLRMPGLSGIELQQELEGRGIRVPLIFMSGHVDEPEAETATKRGAVEFLTKPFETNELIAAVERALARDEETASQRAVSDQLRARWAELPACEQQVCRLVARGLLDKEIAAELGTTEGAVQTQRAAAMKGLGVGSVAELARFLVRLNEL